MEYTARMIVNQLIKRGFKEVRIVGDHHRYADDYGHKVTVPYSRLKDSIPSGTYNSILKQAGIK